MHTVGRGPHYGHAVRRVAVGDRRWISDQAYEEARANQRGGRLGTGADRHSNQMPEPRRTRLNVVAEISHLLLPFLAHSGGCAGLVGADVVNFPATGGKTGWNGLSATCAHERWGSGYMLVVGSYSTLYSTPLLVL